MWLLGVFVASSAAHVVRFRGTSPISAVHRLPEHARSLPLNPHTATPIMTIKAVQHIRRLHGGSQAQLVGTEVDHEYVVKFQGNPQNARTRERIPCRKFSSNARLKWNGVLKACAVISVSVCAHAGAEKQSQEANRLFTRWNTSTTPSRRYLFSSDETIIQPTMNSGRVDTQDLRCLANRHRLPSGRLCRRRPKLKSAAMMIVRLLTVALPSGN